ncbi:MAG: 3-deoxy-D-manno-octulosonic acid transferase [Bacteroidales bacterium]|nr:3-deoxy-D-manno-octulosonic acid transferase [Bacteroidales bacterium]
MIFLYNLAISLLYAAIAIAAIFNPKARKLFIGHRHLLKRLRGAINPEEPILWFHAASTGEFEQGRPVIEEIRKQYPQYKILLTFFSPSGYEAKKNYAGADYIFYMPFDFSWTVRKFYKIVKPRAVFFIKYEFWYNFIHCAHKAGIPVFCFSAIFRSNHFFFRWYGVWHRKLLYEFSYIFVQNQQSKELLNGIGVKQVMVCGDTRFDRVAQIANASKHLPIVESFAGSAKVLVAGSTWPADENLLVRYFHENLVGKEHIKYIIVPHEVDDEQHLNDLSTMFGEKAIRYSQTSSEQKIESYQVLIIDMIGILSSVYRFGYIAYIGGGFGKGIHNILEAATYGIPVVFGPKYEKFQEALDLTQRKGAYSIENYKQLTQTLDMLLYDNQTYQQACTVCKAYVQENIGSTQKILLQIKPWLER